MGTQTQTYEFVPLPEVRDEIVDLWKTGLLARKWKMIEGIQDVDWNEVRQKAIAAWFPQLSRLNIRYAIKYAARLQEVDPSEWKDNYVNAVSSDYYDNRLEQRKKRYKTGGIYTLGAMQTIPDAVDFVYRSLLSTAFDPNLARYIKASIVSRYTQHAVDLMFASIGYRYGWISQADADRVKNDVNTQASTFWSQFAFPEGYSITEDWAYLTEKDGSVVTITITTPE